MGTDSGVQIIHENLTRHGVVPLTPRTEINATAFDPILEKVDKYFMGKDPIVRTAAEQAEFDAPKTPKTKDTRTLQEKIEFYTKGTDPNVKTSLE